MRAEDRLPDRQRWDQRYTSLEPERRTTPTPFVSACLPRLPCCGYALDVAAGAGRNSVALAKHGLQVDAIDVSWHGLHRAAALAARQHTTINPIVLDLARGWLPSRRYDVIVNSMFLMRELMPAIKAALSQGGWLVFETFTITQVAITPHRFEDHDRLLRPGELRQLFPDLSIIDYWEGVEDDRATARLLARFFV